MGSNGFGQVSKILSLLKKLFIHWVFEVNDCPWENIVLTNVIKASTRNIVEGNKELKGTNKPFFPISDRFINFLAILIGFPYMYSFWGPNELASTVFILENKKIR